MLKVVLKRQPTSKSWGNEDRSAFTFFIYMCSPYDRCHFITYSRVRARYLAEILRND